MPNTELFNWFYSQYGDAYSWDDLIFIPRFILELLDKAKTDDDPTEFNRILTVVTEPNQVILHKIQALQGQAPPTPKSEKPTVPGTYINPNPPGSVSDNGTTDMKTGFNIDISSGGIDIQE